MIPNCTVHYNFQNTFHNHWVSFLSFHEKIGLSTHRAGIEPTIPRFHVDCFTDCFTDFFTGKLHRQTHTEQFATFSTDSQSQLKNCVVTWIWCKLHSQYTQFNQSSAVAREVRVHPFLFLRNYEIILMLLCQRNSTSGQIGSLVSYSE